MYERLKVRFLLYYFSTSFSTSDLIQGLRRRLYVYLQRVKSLPNKKSYNWARIPTIKGFS